MQSVSPTSNEKYNELLNQVVRLRLFRNTNRELGEYIGYNLQSNNSIKNISPFTARCIFHELGRETQLQLEDEFDLEFILESYKVASKFYDKYFKGKKKIHQKENLVILLKYYYINDYQIPEEKLFLKEIVSEIFKKSIHVPILLLLILDIIPLYTSKKGDAKNLLGDFNTIFSFIKEFIQHDESLYYLPILSRFEKEARSIYCNRLYLIYVTLMSFETYRGFKNPTDLYAMMNKARENVIVFDLDNYFWVAPKTLSVPAVFWRFVCTETNDYLLFQYSISTEKKSICYTRYEVTFMKDERDGVILNVDHPEKIFNLLGKDKMLNFKLQLFACDIDTSPYPNVIKLQSLMNNDFNFPQQEFVRLQDKEITKQLSDCFEDGTYKIINNFPDTEYLFQNTVPAAITREYIYFKKENNMYYQVPKTLNNGLPSITINDLIGILDFNKCRYIVFDPLHLYIEVTNDECCAKNGVEIVTEIVI